MLCLSRQIAVAVSGLTIVFTLAGCGTAGSFSANSAPVAAAVPLGTFQGSNYGGHAPIVGSHVFVLEGYTSASGYGQAAKSLLSASYTGSYPTAKEPAGTAVAGDYYVTSDSKGFFNVSGDYTCDAGYPVYLYGEGGNPQAPLAYQTSTTVTGATISGTGPYTITFTVPAPSLLYQGESVLFTGSGGNLATYLNGTTQTVLADANLTTTGFDISVSSLTNNGVTLTTGAQSSVGSVSLTQAAGPSNPAIVNLAMLGLCPSTGTANFSYLNFVYMNEVSTTAAAYAMAGFFPTPGSGGLAYAGAAAANLSIPQNDSLALLGLQNAALTASQLYDVQGINNSSCSGATCDGESHVARTTTVGILTNGNTATGSATVNNLTTMGGLAVGMGITGTNLPAGETITAIGASTLTLSTGTGVTAGTNVSLYAGSGNGTVPQALINTVGNILANCVDSANVSGSASTQCTQLFSYTPSAGTSGTLPIDTATAAIDIAHNPWANVTNLVNLPTGNVPFAPTISSANDLSVGIVYKPDNVGLPEGIAIDGKGQIWYPNHSSGYVTTLNPFGGVQYNVAVAGQENYIAIDATGDAWFNNPVLSALQEINGAGAFVNTYQAGNQTGDVGVAVDGAFDTGYVYIGAAKIANTGVSKYTENGTAPSSPADPLTGSVSCLAGQNPGHLAIDNARNGYNLWISSETGNEICEVNTSTGALITKVAIPSAYGTGAEFPAIDAAGSMWVGTQANSAVTKITQGGLATYPSGGTLSGTFGSAVDGAGNVFFTNRTGNGISEYLGSTSAAVSAVNFEGGGNTTVMNDPLNLQVDPSGYIWITNFSGNRIVELLGVAAPTWQPLSDASYYNKLGSLP